MNQTMLYPDDLITKIDGFFSNVIMLVFVLFIVAYLLFCFNHPQEISDDDDRNVDNDDRNVNNNNPLIEDVANDPTPFNKSEYVSVGERTCKEVVEKIFGVRFTKVRPAFLRNPKTGRNLELDVYNEQLKLAIEYNGEQHYVYPNIFHKTQKQFEDQKYRDNLKRELCKAHGITLIVVPYTEKNIESYIRKNLSANCHE